MVNRLALLLGLFLVSLSAEAQKGVIPDDTRTLFLKELSGGPAIHSRGWGVSVRYSRLTPKEKKLVYMADVMNMKHLKEIKIVNPFRDEAKSYVFGKQNVFIPVRTGVGTDKLLFDRALKNGVEVRGIVVGGITHGLLKPVYLRILKDNPSLNTEVEKYDQNRHNRQNILGSAGFFEGIDELGYMPGVFGKAGLSFDWSKDEERIKSVEVGMAFDGFLSDVPIMASFSGEENRKYFLSFYANFLIGKKW